MAQKEIRPSQHLHALTVGDRAHRIAARALHAGVPDSRSQRVLELSRHARSVFDERPVEYRSREALVTATTAAGVYLHRFRPLLPWRLLASELPIDGCRFDLVHELDGDLVLVDELKLGVGRADEAAVRKQIDRYVELGSAEWGSRFVGVRLCAIHEPTQSRLYAPDRQRSVLLTDSDLDAGVMVR